MRVVLLIVALVVAGVVGWKKRDEIPFLRDATRQVERQVQNVELPKVPGLSSANDAPASGGGQPAPGSVRRCLVNGSVLYTNDACPAGSTEQKVKGGTVSTMPGYKAPAPAASGTGIPNARELLAPKDGTLKDKAAEKIMEGL